MRKETDRVRHALQVDPRQVSPVAQCPQLEIRKAIFI